MGHHYSIVRNADGTWVIRTEGRDILLCARKSDAVKIVQAANVLAEKLVNATPKPDTSANRAGIVRLSFDGGRKSNCRRT